MVYTNDKAGQVLEEILDSMDNGRYPLHEGDAGYFKENGKWIAFDNSTCDCWVEEFKTKKEAIKWIEE